MEPCSEQIGSRLGSCSEHVSCILGPVYEHDAGKDKVGFRVSLVAKYERMGEEQGNMVQLGFHTKEVKFVIDGK